MNENSFNVCSRCGSANPLSAKYCYQCGYELKSPESPVVCTKCNTVNQGSANFCKRCGSKLPKAQPKVLCPQCSASNNASAPYCANCGFDFTTSTMPSSLSLAGMVAGQPQKQPVATDAVAATNVQNQKLSRKEKKLIKRQEEERRYRERLEAHKQAKRDAKKAKKDAKAQTKTNNNQGVQQPVYPVVQYPVANGQPVPVQYIPPVIQQIVVEPPKEKKTKKYRIKNLIVFLIALIGLYFILLPQQANLFKSLGLLVYTSEGVPGVKLTGWDIVLSVLANFVPNAANLSTMVGTYTFDSIEMFITGFIMSIVVIELVFIILAKLFGMMTGRPHKGFDLNAFAVFLITGGAFAYAYLHGIRTIVFSKFAIIVPLVFLAIAIANTTFKKEK